MRMTAIAATFFALLALDAAAQSFGADRLADPGVAHDAIRLCLAENPGAAAGADCIGVVADRCLSAQNGDAMIAMGACVAAEASGWDRELNATYVQSMNRLDAPSRAALRTAQRKWLEFRDASCAVWDEVFRGGTLARLSALNCLRVATARRTLDLIAIRDSVER